MNPNTLTSKVFNGFFWQFGGTIFQTGIQLAVLFVLARLLSHSDFGTVQVALIIVGFANLLSQLGVGPAIVQKKILTETDIKAGFTLSLGLSIILFIGIQAAAGLLAEFFEIPKLENILRIISFLFIIEGITTISQSLLLREMKQRILVQIDFFSYLLGYGSIALLLSYLGYGVWSLIIAQVCQSLLKCVLSYSRNRHTLKLYFGRAEIKELTYFGGGFTVARFFNYFANQGDNIIIGKFLGSAALGLYGRAYSIMVKPVAVIGDALDKALFPAFASRQNQKEKIVTAFINSSKLIVFLTLPLSVIVFFSAKEIVMVLLGEKWIETTIPLRILTAGLFFRLGYRMGSIITKALGDIYRRAIVELLYFLFIVINCSFGVRWGLAGVSWGVFLSLTLNYIIMISLSLKILNLSWKYFIAETSKSIPVAVIVCILFIVIRIGIKLIFVSEIMILLFSIMVFGITSAILFYRFGSRLDFLASLPNKGIFKRKERINL